MIQSLQEMEGPWCIQPARDNMQSFLMIVYSYSILLVVFSFPSREATRFCDAEEMKNDVS